MSTYNSNSRHAKLFTGSGSVTAGPPVNKTYRKAKMGFFRRKFMEWSKRAWDESRSVDVVSRSDIHEVESIPQLNFKIYGALGGHIMEFRRYNQKNDHWDNQLYVISTDDDIGERVARIVNMEILK